ncbi:MAG: hypothetical protein SGPRY_007935, partial [Prymnesium sp.]
SGSPIHPTEGEECEDDLSTPPAPIVTLHGDLITPPVTESLSIDGRSIQMRTLHDELQLTYVHNFLSAQEVEQLLSLADARAGWARSPLKKQGGGESLNVAEKDTDARRTSSSCPLLWPLAYESRRKEIESNPDAEKLLSELKLTSLLSSRVASMLKLTGLDISPAHIEPLQLVRYKPGERFGPHHDFHATGKSSVQGEQVQKNA